MTDRPIIFSAPMVRALLEGRKTQTRRLAWGKWLTVQQCAGRDRATIRVRGDDERAPAYAQLASPWQRARPGDRLWVREAWAHDGPDLETVRSRFEDIMGSGIGYGPYYRVGEVAPDTLRWRPSIHMPRWASRITLTVTDVRRQRVQEISEEDARAEGLRAANASAREYFKALWGELHGKWSWLENPEVVALTFTVAKRNIDQQRSAA